MEAIVRRTQTILESMKAVLRLFPNEPPPEHTAEDLVMQLPPEHLLKVLERAYQCNLYSIFARYIPPPHGPTLEKASRTIRERLEQSEAAKIERLIEGDPLITCIPSKIGLLQNVQVLILDGCQIASIPPSVGQLQKLVLLGLGYNQLRRLPPEVGQLANLEALCLQHNRLGKIPPEFGRLQKLRKLCLHGNRIREIPSNLSEWLKNSKSFG